jgi:hypothetical protein
VAPPSSWPNCTPLRRHNPPQQALQELGRLPDEGVLRVDARFAGFEDEAHRLPVFDLQLCRENRIVLTMRLVEVLLPLGPFAGVSPTRRRAFLRDHTYVEEMLLGATDGAATVVRVEELSELDWLPGSIASAYNLGESTRIADHVDRIAVANHVARTAKVHPCHIVVAEDLTSAWVIDRPESVYRVSVTEDRGQWTVVDR